MTISEQIIEILNYLCEKVGLVIDWTVVFANENVIPYIKDICGRLVTYELVTSIAWLIAGIIFLIIALRLFKLAKKYYDIYQEEGGYSNYDSCTWLLIFGVVSLAICILLVMIETYDIINCLILPEKIIIHELMNIYENIK